MEKPMEIVPAYILEAHYGMGDYGKPALSFTVCLDPSGLGSCAFQYFTDETEIEIIFSSFAVKHAVDLNGRSCFVKQGSGLILYYAAPNDILI